MITKKKAKLDDAAINKVANIIVQELKELRKDDLDFTYSLLNEKEELQKKFERTTTLMEKDKELLSIANQKIIDNELKIKDLELKISALKAEKKLISNSLGGCKTKNKNLQEKLGEQKLLIKYLQNRLRLKKPFAPTMKELRDYDHHKSREEVIK